MFRTPPKDSRLCGTCNTQLSPNRNFPHCESCQNSYHYKCIQKTTPSNSTPLHQRTWQNWTPEQKQSWKCDSCIANIQVDDPLDDTSFQIVNRSKKRSLPSPASKNINKRLAMDTTESNNSLLDQIRQIIREEMKEQKEDISSIKNTLLEVQNLTAQQANEINQLKRINTDLQVQVEGLNQKLNNVEQYQKRQDVIVSGIPPLPSENPIETTMTLCTHMEIQLEKWELLNAHRLHKRASGDIPLIIRFNSPKVRDKMLAKAKEINLSAHIFGGNQNTKLYINEHLTVANQKLLKTAKTLHKGAGYRFVWSKNGKIYARETENSKVLLINTEQDIVNILANLSNSSEKHY